MGNNMHQINPRDIVPPSARIADERFRGPVARNPSCRIDVTTRNGTLVESRC